LKLAPIAQKQTHLDGPLGPSKSGLTEPHRRLVEFVLNLARASDLRFVGYTEPRRLRKYLGSLVLAVRDKAKKR
jgi:hypothetical protein